MHAHPLHAPTTVIVCAYTLDRLALTERCLAAVLAQVPSPTQVVAVVDHNDELAARLAASFPAVEVVANAGPPGLSAARNTGIERATGEIVAFVDDDAEPAPGWLADLLRPFEDPAVTVAGGRAEPAWETAQPSWFPDEFLWVVGCSYRGQRTSGRVRNPLGCNMAFRRSAFERVGGFDLAVGRLGTLPLGCEETEICLRIVRSIPDASIVMVDGAPVSHAVPVTRGTVGYFVRRCFYEGVSKAVLRGLADQRALATEGDYVLRALTSGAIRRLGRAVRLDRPVGAVAGIAMMAIGVAAASLGYAYGRLRSPGRTPRPTAIGAAPRPERPGAARP